MSVQTQIDRISGAVSAALTALAEKGVTVPDGTKVDGLAALIAAIEAGGGGGGGSEGNATILGWKVFCGTFSVASDSYQVTLMTRNEFLELNGGNMPTRFLVGYWLPTSPVTGKAVIGFGINKGADVVYATGVQIYKGDYGDLERGSLVSSMLQVLDSSDGALLRGESKYKFAAGEIYNWILLMI